MTAAPSTIAVGNTVGLSFDVANVSVFAHAAVAEK
jgi:hypothetical protein